VVVRFKVFRSAVQSWNTWNTLFEQAAEFANSIRADCLINISHSGDNSIGVVTVWYWGKPGDNE